MSTKFLKNEKRQKQNLILATFLVITLMVFFASFTFPEAIYQLVRFMNSLFIPSLVRDCLTPVIPVKNLPKDARFIESFHFIVEEENGKLHITKLKIYKFQNDYYAVFNNATLKAGYPQACEKYYSIQQAQSN